MTSRGSSVTMETEKEAISPAECEDHTVSVKGLNTVSVKGLNTVSVKGLNTVSVKGLNTVSVKGLKENWQKWCSEHQQNQKHNPFSHDSRHSVGVSQVKLDYGRPLQGSLTEQRGQEAHTHISKEIKKLCEAIKNIGEPKEKDGVDGGSSRKVIAVEFGKLFQHYVAISNKLVGILLRARKQRLVEFEGEMLWQGKDDHVLIFLVE